jgi:hypothetical protein
MKTPKERPTPHWSDTSRELLLAEVPHEIRLTPTGPAPVVLPSRPEEEPL